MYGISELYEPESLAETLEILRKKNETKVIAGGTDILLKFRHKGLKNIPLVSLRKIKELAEIKELGNGSIKIGSMATFTQVAKDPIVKEKIKFLTEAACTMGGPQIRNVATIGGNLCNGATSADSAPALFTLEAKLLLQSSSGSREVAIADFYYGPSQVDLRQDEILTAVIIPAPHQGKWGGHYYKYSMRKAMDISTLGCAALCKVDQNDRIEDLKIALGTAAPTPIRCKKAEKLGINKIIKPELLLEIGEAAAAEANPRSSWRASKEFRLSLVKELTARALVQAYRNAGGEYLDENY